MHALLRLQFELQKKRLLFIIASLIIIGFIFSSSQLYTIIPILAYALSMNIANSDTFLSNNMFYQTLNTMPIKREQIVKGSALFNFLIVIIIFAILTPFQINAGIAEGNLSEYIAIFIGFFSSAILTNATRQYFTFTNEKVEMDYGEDTLATLGSIFVVMAPHALFYLIGSEETFYIRMMIMPVITCLLYFIILKITIRNYKEKEIV